jgi:FxLD family lantipeptide
MSAADPGTAPVELGDDFDFDLDVRIIESAQAIPDLMRSTDDNCGATCASACVSCRS